MAKDFSVQQALVTRLIESEPWLIAALPAPWPLTEKARAFEQGLYDTQCGLRDIGHRYAGDLASVPRSASASYRPPLCLSFPTENESKDVNPFCLGVCW